MLAVAAEKMKNALNKLIIRELKRGFDAWMMEMTFSKRIMLTSKIDKFIHLRRIVYLMNEGVLRRLRRRFEPWKAIMLHYKMYVRKALEKFSATKIQKIARGRKARKRVAILKERGKYQAMYSATILIQSIIRGKLKRWKYMDYLRKRLEDKCSRLIQRVYRGHRGRTRARKERKKQDRSII